MEFRRRTLMQIADLICGNESAKGLFYYRSSSKITEFFRDADTDYAHNGSTRNYWVADTLANILKDPQPQPNTLPEAFLRVIRVLMDQGDALNESTERKGALDLLNAALQREGYEAFYGEDKQCYLKHIGTSKISGPSLNPHRPLTELEQKKRTQLADYLDKISEDQLIEEILLPMFRQLGFHRVTATGHKDKNLEYGKDVWMKYTLPTMHVIYFGIQAKKGKIDASGVSTANISEIYNQVLMMIGYEIFDPEIGKRVLVDHAFIIAGGEITKSAKNWLANKLDNTQRNQILFMDRKDILDLFVVANLPLPSGALPVPPETTIGLDDLPF